MPFAALAQNTINEGGQGGNSTRDAMQDNNVDRLPPPKNANAPTVQTSTSAGAGLEKNLDSGVRAVTKQQPRVTSGDGDGIEDGDESQSTLKSMQESNVDRLPVR
ncbi:hypothetical protein L1787_21020 [Acuticoccus sp. M5D2P5]|uniref:hypothetical protein n=1 Tax=Acuticoccus kalidii TaxID=2910977 RepID=UPI001F29346E|nr:hypothetical protein [Acuticoccus kalidii]MCF3935875.1 hypothetical protein [Acuticoccus kalidii]